MTHFDRDEDTICALTTGAGQSGVAVIRVSGPSALFFVRQLCLFLPEAPASHRVYHGMLKDQERAIDEVLVSYFAEGKSFTGQETCEISCHGSPIVASQILSSLILRGCRPAERGEFTYRAFMSGRIDLVQAESVLNLIESSSKKAAQLALEQLQGQLSHLFRDLEEGIIWILSRIEAGIDFSTEGLEVVSPDEVRSRLEHLSSRVQKLILSYRDGRLITEGIRIVLAGKPNAGKSSLLNALIRTDRAIVSPIAGTTRDTIEATYKIEGVSATVVDTAGLRDATNEIERLGVERSERAIASSDLLVYVVDAGESDPAKIEFEISTLSSRRHILVLNKIDLVSFEKRKEWKEKLPSGFLEMSAKSGVGLSELEDALAREFKLDASDETAIVICARHEQQLQIANAALARAREAFSEGISHEFVCLDLRESLLAIGNILGKGLDEDVIGRIFKDFCIGK